MNIGILIPGFGANEDDWALPVYQNFVRELAKTHDVRVIALRYPHTRESYMYHGAKVYPLGWGAWTKGLNRLRLWWDTWQTIKRLHAEKPFDILHGIWADETGALSGWIGNRLDIPSVTSMAGGEMRAIPEIKYGLQLSFYGQWITIQALKHNTHIILPGSMGNREIIEWLPDKASVIPLGVDYNLFQRSTIARTPNHLVHVGSLIPVKNQKMLLETMTYLSDDVTLDIIGEGVLEDDLKHYAQELGISQRVNFLGKIPHQQLPEYYSRAQLHVMTSHHEAYGMAIVEAAACGTPTIGTEVGLVADEVDFTLMGDSAEEIAGIIKSYLETPRDLKQLQRRSANIIKKHYTIQHMTEEYLQLYDILI